jgi:flavin-dependent dehydrogenase
LAKRGKSKWYGLKGHIQNFTLMSDLELHFVNDGYIGLCNVGNRWTNVCGLFRRSHEAPSAPGDFLEHFQREPSIQNRLLDACWQQESLVATAGLPIEHDEDGEPGQFAVGDAFSMIPPFTGNGMSLAIESALLAVSPLVNYARDAVSWSETTTAYQSARHSRFHHRIRFARRVQKLLVSQPFKSALSLFINFTPLWRSVFSATR